MNRERAMQRLNMLTLAAFLLGLGAFVYDANAPEPAPLVADASDEAMAYLANMAPALP